MESPSAQQKRKLQEVDEKDAKNEPNVKWARMETTDGSDQALQEAFDESAVAEVRELVGRRKRADVKAIIDREYAEEVSMAPGGEHSTFMKELQSRAEIVNSGAIQNEGNKAKLLNRMDESLKQDGADEEEAAALAIIRGTQTGEEDESVSIDVTMNGAGAGKPGNSNLDKLYLATGIPKGLKFEINVRQVEGTQADGKTELDLDVIVSVNPKLNLDALKAKSSLAHKGAMARRRLPTRALQPAKRIALAEEVETNSGGNGSVADVPVYKSGMSTAEKVRATLAAKAVRPADADQEILATQRQILKQAYRPDAGFSVESDPAELLEEKLRRTSLGRRQVTPSSGEEEDEKSYRPSMAKLAELERRPRTKSSGDFDLSKIRLKKRDSREEITKRREKGLLEQVKLRKATERSGGDKQDKTASASEFASVFQRVRSMSEFPLLKKAEPVLEKETALPSTVRPADDSSQKGVNSTAVFLSSRGSDVGGAVPLRKTGFVDRYTGSMATQLAESPVDGKKPGGEGEKTEKVESPKSPRVARPAPPPGSPRGFERKASGGMATANILKPPAQRNTPSPIDAVPEWKKTLLERRKMGGAVRVATPRVRVSNTSESSATEEMPAWKRELMSRRKDAERKRSSAFPERSSAAKEFEGTDQRKMKESVSVSQLTSRMSRVSVNEEDEKVVPSFLKEFQAKQRRTSRNRESGSLEPEWMRQLKKNQPSQIEEV
eukprot:m.16344 g.16344  ORF g.16344 m.16344 type:complete len:722 (+) comp26868_c0_seq1:136-2301(+)